MRNRIFPPLAIALSILLTHSPVQAGPVVVNNVVQVLTSYQNPPDLRLRGFSQISSPLTYGVIDYQQTGGDQRSKKESSGRSSQGTEIPDSLLAGIAVDAGSQPLGVELSDDVEVDGTICDCGEIFVPGGPPKWPFVFLAAIPLFFIHNDDSPNPTPTPPNNQVSPTPTPTPPPASPTPTPTTVPEPGSLLLLGTGIIAVGGILRKRYFMGTDRNDSRDAGGLSQ